MPNKFDEKHNSNEKVTSKCLQETIFKKLKVHIANLKKSLLKKVSEKARYCLK